MAYVCNVFFPCNVLNIYDTFSNRVFTCVDPLPRHLYFVVEGESSMVHIERCHLDGSSRERVVSVLVFDLLGLAIDIVNNVLYWTEFLFQYKICSLDMNQYLGSPLAEVSACLPCSFCMEYSETCSCIQRPPLFRDHLVISQQ